MHHFPQVFGQEPSILGFPAAPFLGSIFAAIFIREAETFPAEEEAQRVAL